MTPLMNARLESSVCVSVASLLLMSSSMAVALHGPATAAPGTCAAASLSIARYFQVMQPFGELRVAKGCMQAHRGASTQAGVSDRFCHPDGRRHWRPWR